MRLASFRIFACVVPILCFALPACSGVSTPVAPPTPVANAAATIVLPPFGLQPSAGATTALLLAAPLFLAPNENVGTATVALSPAEAAHPKITWAASNATVSLMTPAPAGSPQPGSITVVGTTPGTATLSAQVGAPYNVGAALPIFYYASAEIGCDFRAVAGQSFDPIGSSSAPSTSLGDFYATGPVAAGDGLNPCGYGGYETPAGTPIVFHFPYGATIATDGNDATRPVVSGAQRAAQFPYQTPAIWRNDFTTIDASALLASAIPCPSAAACTTINGGVIVFKTAGGRIVKFDIFEIDNDGAGIFGAYEVSDLTPKYPF